MIYIFFKGAFPHGMAGSQRVLCYAKGLIAEGAEVEVVIPCRTERGVIRNKELSKEKQFFLTKNIEPTMH